MTEALERIDLRSVDIAEDRRQELLRLFPEVRTEGNSIDFDRLRAALGEMVDAGKERYGLTWPGKADTFRTIQAPSLGTLLPAPEESVNFDTTEHLIIEGDNLEVLKLLQKSYLGQVKMIYIDPPYNTGNDFIYPDDYSESLQTYLEYTGQVDSEGRKFGTNTDAEGRFHSRWLNMMYPRLYLARNLLREDGVMFISIDDNEVENLKRLLTEIFGEEHFVAQIVVQTNPRGRTLDRFLAKTFEYVLVVARDASSAAMYEIPKSGAALAAYDKSDEKGSYRELELRNRNPVFNRGNRPNLFFPLYVDPVTGEVSLAQTAGFREEAWPRNANGDDGCWTWSRAKIEREGNLLVGRRVGTGVWRVFRKDYVPEGGATTKDKSLWLDSSLNHENGKEVLGRIFGKTPFDFPKSTALVGKMLMLATRPNEGDIVLDFFAGSGTTAQAVLDLNGEDGGNRTFILAQLPEPTGRADYPTIADITKERVRRVIDRMDEDRGKLNLDADSWEDRGFRVLKLGASNFIPWDSDKPKDGAALAQQLAMHVDHIRDGRCDLDLLYEILLKSGYPLSTRVETTTVAGKTVYSVAEGALLVCLERHLTLDLIRAIAERQPERVVLLDVGFEGNDQLKTNAVQTFKNARREDAEPIVFRTI